MRIKWKAFFRREERVWFLYEITNTKYLFHWTFWSFIQLNSYLVEFSLTIKLNKLNAKEIYQKNKISIFVRIISNLHKRYIFLYSYKCLLIAESVKVSSFWTTPKHFFMSFIRLSNRYCLFNLSSAWRAFRDFI